MGAYMGVFKIDTNVALDVKEKRTFMREVSSLLGSLMESSEEKIFIKYNNTDMISGGVDKPSAHIQLASTEKISPSTNRLFCSKISDLVNRYLSVGHRSILIVFTELSGANVGWNRSTMSYY